MRADLRKPFGGRAGTGANRPLSAIQHRDASSPATVFVPPHPLRATLLAPIPSLAPFGLLASGAISAAAAIVSGGVLACMAGAHIGYARFDLWRCRRLADELLSAHHRATVSSPLVAWRSAELTSARTRRNLAEWVHGVIRDAEPPRVRLVWTPLNRAAARRNLFLLRRLEQRLSDLSRPVSPRGVLVVQELLADGTRSPLYRQDRADALPDALAEALAGLDVPR